MIQAVRFSPPKAPVRFGCDECGGKNKTDMKTATEHPDNSLGGALAHHADHIGMGVVGTGALLLAYLLKKKKQPDQTGQK